MNFHKKYCKQVFVGGEAKDSNDTTLLKINRIILLTHEYPPEKGGAGIYCKEIAESAHKQKIDIQVWAPRGCENSSSFFIKELPWKGSQSWLSSIFLIFHLKSFIGKGNKGITLHIAELGACRAFIRFGWLLPKNIPKIITLHGSELINFTRNPIERFLFRKLLNDCDKVHVLSKFNRDQCGKFCDHLKSKIRLIPGAPSSVAINEKLTTINPKKSDLRQILCVGRIHPRKGQLELLQALNLIPVDLQKNIRMIFAGPVKKPSYQKKLENLADTFAGEVKFTGETTNLELKLLYQNSDLFSLTPKITKNSVEGFGFVYLEASAFGLPIIATKVGGVEDAVKHGKTGLLSDPNSQEELKKNIIKLVENPSLGEKLGTNGVTWAKLHNWETVAQKLYQEN